MRRVCRRSRSVTTGYTATTLRSAALSRNSADTYQRRQTLKNVEFITPELKTFEDKALSVKSGAGPGKAPLRGLVAEVAESLAPLQATAAPRDLDVLACFAERATALDLCRPFTDHTLLQIEEVVTRGGGSAGCALYRQRHSLITTDGCY